jgi:hypothetical protein
METTLAILMVLGIYIGIPTVIGLVIAGMFLFSDRRVRRAERARAVAEAQLGQPTEEATREPTTVA